MAQSQSRAAQPGRNRAPRQRAAGGTLLGIFIGLVMGLVLAAGVAYYLMGGRSVYQSQVNAQKNVREPAADAAKLAANDKASDKPRFDFYKILPGGEEPRVGADRKAADKPGERTAATAPESVAKAGPAGAIRPADRMWLQAGAFASESDAESLKARLALAGWEAAVQSATLPDQGVRYRVRVGPFDNTDEVNRVKTELGKSGFDAAVIKNQ
ncbi:MAG: SPOR domain-containing protein [Burkholderiales bacterium]